jgi:hypothetical protein
MDTPLAPVYSGVTDDGSGSRAAGEGPRDGRQAKRKRKIQAMQSDETGNRFAVQVNNGLGMILIVLWAAVARRDAWSLPGRTENRQRAPQRPAGMIDVPRINAGVPLSRPTP